MPSIIWLSIVKLCQTLLCLGDQHTFCIKEYIVNTFGFASHKVFVPTTAELCCCDMKAAPETDSSQVCPCVSN